MKTSEKIRKYIEMDEWLEACPFTDAMPFYETAANGEFRSFYEEIADEIYKIDEVIWQRFIEQVQEPDAVLSVRVVLDEVARDVEAYEGDVK
jgi:hypothetical protein